MFDVYCYKGKIAWRHEISIRHRSGLTATNNYKLKKSLIYAEVSESKPIGEVITIIDTACPYYFRKSFLIGLYFAVIVASKSVLYGINYTSLEKTLIQSVQSGLKSCEN